MGVFIECARTRVAVFCVGMRCMRCMSGRFRPTFESLSCNSLPSQMKVLELVDALEANQSYGHQEVQQRAEKYRQKLLKVSDVQICVGCRCVVL